MESRPKTILTITLVALFILTSGLVMVDPGYVTASQEAGYSFTTSGTPSVATITAYNGPGGAITVPTSLAGYKVTAIGQNAFHSVPTLRSVVIPEGITAIGSGAFAYCNNMTSITVPDSVTVIGNWAFSFCHSLTLIDVYSANPDYRSLDGLLYDRNGTTLIQCPGARTGTVVVPNGINTIDSEAFAGCSQVSSVELPNTTTDIGEFAFANCYGLSSISLPESIRSIGAGAFTRCTHLTDVNIPGAINTWGAGTFFQCSALVNVTIEPGVTSVGASAFDYCTSLSSIALPESVTSIGTGAFYQCSAMRSIVIPAKVTSIANQTFENCSSLSEIRFIGNAPSVGRDWASGCATNITVVYGPNATGFTTPTWNGINTIPASKGDQATGGQSNLDPGTLLAIAGLILVGAIAALLVLRRRRTGPKD